MTINLSVRNFVLTIGGIDCSRACVSFVGADEKLEPTRGIVSFTGTIELHRPKGFESLDDRRNNRWARGQAITLQIADSNNMLRPPPRGGALYILESEYNLETRRLTLKVGDAFALYQNNQPKGDASKICLGTNSSKTSIINNLLSAACISPIMPPDTVPGGLSAPTPRAIEGSYVEQAGAIAASSGYFLYKDGLGNTRSKAVSIAPYPAIAAVTIVLANQAAIYNRTYGKQPAQRMIVTGRATLVEPTGDTFTETTVEYGPASMLGVRPRSPNATPESPDPEPPDPEQDIIVRISTVVDKYSKSAKRRIITTRTQEPAALALPGFFPGDGSLIVSGYQVENYYYETNAPITGTDNTDPCQRGNQGRLKSYDRYLQKPIGAVFSEIFAAQITEQGPPPGMQNLTFAEDEVIFYDYNFRREVDVFGFSNEENETTSPSEIKPLLSPGIQHERKLFMPAGAIAPSPFINPPANSTSDNPGPRLLNYSERRLAELDRDQWFEETSKTWEYRRAEWRSLALAKPETVALLDESEADIGAYTGLLNILDRTQISNTGNTQPPSPDVHPPDFFTRDIAVRGRSFLPVNAAVPECAREYRSDLTFEYLSGNGVGSIQEQANRLAEIWGKWSWGLYKAAQITTDLSDALFDFQPLDRIDFVEDSTAIDGVASYLGDGFGIAISGNRCAIDIDGVFLGFADVAAPELILPIYQERPQSPVGEGETGVAVVRNDGPIGAPLRSVSIGAEGEFVDATVPETLAFDGSEGEFMDSEYRRIALTEGGEGEFSEIELPLYWEQLTAQEWIEIGLPTYIRIRY